MPLERIDLGQALPPLEWLVAGLLLQGYINTVASLPGEGKTALLTALAWQVSRPAGTFLNRRVAHGVTLYVDFDAPGQGRTVRYWLEKHRRAFPDGDANEIIVFEPDPNTYGLAEAELEQLATTAKASRARLILIDSFGSAFPSVDPIKLVQVQGPLWHLRRLAGETGAALVIVDHLPKPISGERAGARGIIGSVAKSAQARAVHILSRVPPKEVEGRSILRWDTTKMSYGARPAPFGVELRFGDGTVFIEATDLPEGRGETRTERAVRALQDHLEAKRGAVVTHQRLLELAVEEGNLRKRAAAEAVRRVRERYGSELTSTVLPGRGQPQGYVLAPERDDTVVGSLHRRPPGPFGSANLMLHAPASEAAPNAPAKPREGAGR